MTRLAGKTGGGPQPEVDFPEPDPDIFRYLKSTLLHIYFNQNTHVGQTLFLVLIISQMLTLYLDQTISLHLQSSMRMRRLVTRVWRLLSQPLRIFFLLTRGKNCCLKCNIAKLSLFRNSAKALLIFHARLSE